MHVYIAWCKDERAIWENLKVKISKPATNQSMRFMTKTYQMLLLLFVGYFQDIWTA